jgi:hypothetical protein
MNIKNRLRHLAQLSAKDRATGRSTMTARAAKELDGIVIANTHSEARQIAKTHGVAAKSYEMNLDGFMGPFFFDHHAIETLLTKAANKIEALERRNRTIISKLEDVLRELKEDDDSTEKADAPDPEYPRSGAV